MSKAFLATLSLALIACAPPERVYVIGDSISIEVAGGGDPWPLQAFGPDANNWAVPGTRVDDWLDDPDGKIGWDWRSEVEPGGTFYVILGTNSVMGELIDPVMYPNVHAERFPQLIEQLVVDLRAGSVWIVHSPPWWACLDAPSCTDPLLFWAAVNADIASQRALVDEPICSSYFNVVCGPDLMANTELTDLLPGGIHYSDAGHAKVAALVQMHQLCTLVPDAEPCQ